MEDQRHVISKTHNSILRSIMIRDGLISSLDPRKKILKLHEPHPQAYELMITKKVERRQ